MSEYNVKPNRDCCTPLGDAYVELEAKLQAAEATVKELRALLVKAKPFVSIQANPDYAVVLESPWHLLKEIETALKDTASDE